MKKCSDCQIEKDIEEFSFSDLKAGKRQKRCKSCQRIRSNNHYKRTKDETVDIRAARNKTSREKRFHCMDEIKAKTGCILCQESEPAALDFHHLGDKTASISRLVRQKANMEIIMAEVSKCVILCANCHRKVHAGIITLNDTSG